MYHYPYVYYPQNFWSSEYYQSSDDLYHRYPPEMQVPVYNKRWHNMYPEGALYHSGHHFILDHVLTRGSSRVWLQVGRGDVAAERTLRTRFYCADV